MTTVLTSFDVAIGETNAPAAAVAKSDRRGRCAAKRFLDVSLAFLALVVLAPFLLAVALTVRLSDGGPALFSQERVGRDGIAFRILKFRTMCEDAEERLESLRDLDEGQGPLFKVRCDPRVTGVGAWLRRTSIDELPQLWNVMRGDMSLVGPRPALPREVAEWAPEVHGRLAVRPGITGPWQVNGRSDLPWEDGVRLDLDYAEDWSVRTDLLLMARTVPRVLRSEGAY